MGWWVWGTYPRVRLEAIAECIVAPKQRMAMADVLHEIGVMSAAPNPERVLAAPEFLGLETRADFRRQAVEILDQLPEVEGRLVIDLEGTHRLDSAGLGTLMLVQRHAEERRQRVVLRSPSDEVRYLLALTRLLDLFILEAAAR